MDFRLRKYIAGWTSKTIKNGFDRVAIAGGIKNLPFVLKQVELSIKLHHVCEVYMINHEDCGAYGDEGTPEKHKKDLLFARRIIKEKFPKLKVVPLYLKLDGEFLPIKV
jgi:hypothetical protein